PSRFFGQGPDSLPTRESSVLLIYESVAKFIEAFEFAARLSAALPKSDRMSIKIGAHALEGRHLETESPAAAMFLRRCTAHLSELVKEEEFSREQLMAESDQIALVWVRELFRRFGWNPEPGVL